MEEITPKSRGEIFEGIAFQFCKVATVALLAGRFVLPVSSALCAGFFVAAYLSGKRDTRCWFKHPLLAAGFFALICGGWFWFNR